MFRRRVTATILNRPLHAGVCECGGWMQTIVVVLDDVIAGPEGVVRADICTLCRRRQIAREGESHERISG